MPMLAENQAIELGATRSTHCREHVSLILEGSTGMPVKPGHPRC